MILYFAVHDPKNMTAMYICDRLGEICVHTNL